MSPTYVNPKYNPDTLPPTESTIRFKILPRWKKNNKSENVVVIAGNNGRKADYIQQSIAAGFDVLADKPMIIQAKDFDLLVMGTNGADDYNDFFFGSHSYQVAIESLIPVLLIPSTCRYKEIATMVYAYDYEHEQQLPVAQLSKWAELIKAKITVLKIKSHYSREVEVNSKEVEERVVNSNDLPDVKFDTVYEDDTFIGVHNYFVKNEYDALSVCSTQHSFITNIFHKSLIKELSSGANYPLFIFHE